MHIGGGGSTWLDAAEPGRDPGEEVVEGDGPSVRVYAVAHGHCVIFGCSHKLRMILQWPFPCDHNTEDREVSLEY
ncbi:hypothetical protein GCM10018965_080190 [Nonomuraea roseola]